MATEGKTLDRFEVDARTIGQHPGDAAPGAGPSGFTVAGGKGRLPEFTPDFRRRKRLKRTIARHAPTP
ncbi:hypothetical protein kuro4_18460 [Gelria sp. Kuro-4]|nr:hypothetical protein kuro4_18460 [Gelria sp. Kuro-4]